MIRVAQVMHVTEAGGIESVVMNYYRHVDRSQVQFDFYVDRCSKIVDREEIESLGGRVFIIPHYIHVFEYIGTLKKYFKEQKYDVVHSNMNALSVFSLYAAKRAGIAVRIAHSHSTTDKKEIKKNFVKNVLKRFSRLFATDYLACSETAGRWLFGNKTFEKGKVTVVNNAVEIDRFTFDESARRAERARLGLADKFVVGHIGRFVAQKNQLFLLEVFKEIKKLEPESALLLLGDGPLKAQVIARCEELGLAADVKLIGVTASPETYYQAMDCFLLPSLYEGLPVVGVEAQVNGLPCYFSDKITQELAVTPNARYIPLEKSAAEWAREIVGAKNEQRRRSDESAFASFDIDREAEQLLGIYKKLTGAQKK